MKFTRSQRAPTPPAGTSEPRSDRRSLVVGAGVAAGAALAAAALHRHAIEAPAQVEARPKVGDGDGYQLTDHVLRYYQTARS
ncbi:MAG TPA: formate dehydrogenase [Caldimonas sp.]|jgi:hypothetical protein